jgi:hypothetical protein
MNMFNCLSNWLLENKFSLCTTDKTCLGIFANSDTIIHTNFFLLPLRFSKTAFQQHLLISESELSILVQRKGKIIHH